MMDLGQAVFDSVRARRASSMVTFGPLPSTLAEALPNRTFRVEDGSRTVAITFSVAVVVGEIIDVQRGPAYTHVADDRLQHVDFDDPAAVERTIDVPVRVQDLFDTRGQTAPPRPDILTFRWGGLGRLDAPARSEYMASMASIGRVVAVLDTRVDPDGQVYIPILRGALLGRVKEDDTLEFPGLDREEEFLGEITTLAALSTAARAAPRVSRWNGPLIN